jgi:hypothetical protein
MNRTDAVRFAFGLTLAVFGVIVLCLGAWPRPEDIVAGTSRFALTGEGALTIWCGGFFIRRSFS